ncbi:MAG TPA: penicillin-binding transpeptidase domain-containing protein [Pyrinomonadaceae bacterium]|nr:penicillin-binding transpeptidase domain-containing protein [Pyrinomonadaceae bacterium]
MTRRLPSPASPKLIVLLFGLLLAPASLATAAPRKPAKAPAAKATTKKPAAKKSARAERGREKSSSRKEVAKKPSARERGRNTKNERQAASRTNARTRNDRASRNDKRNARESNTRASRNDRRSKREEARASSKDKRKMTRRERLAEERREAERRRREAAERARQAAIARAIALARIRAQDQALRDETSANILKDDTTGEDPEVRRVAVEALAGQAGSVVVMDPKSGRVYTVVNQDWGVRKGFKPCSTIKLVTGLAGLSESVIDPVQTVNISTGTLRIDLTDSLAFSNNYYFQKVGGQVGFERMMAYARKLGLGQPTGINHANESPGRLPVSKEGWALNRMSSHGDDIEVTPVQLANMASTIANGGKLLVPHLPRTPQEAVKFKREVRADIDDPVEDNLRRLVPGMIGAVNYGTGHRAYSPTQTIAGKTGTCIGQGTWLGLFASYAPVHDPQLAVAVVTRGSGARGKHAAAVAGKIYRNLAHRFSTRGTPTMLAEDLKPRPKIDPRKALAVSDEEAEANDSEALVRETEAEVSTDAALSTDAAKGVATPVAPVRTTTTAPSSGVTLTSKTYERPVVSQPARKSSSTAGSDVPLSKPGGETRPRRVNPDR